MKSLFKAVALITFFSVLTRVAGFIFRIYLSRVIGAEALGMYQVAQSVFMVLLTVIASGIPLIISRMNASYRAKKDSKSEGKLTSTALIFASILSLLLCAIVFLFKGIFSRLFTDIRCVQILIVMLPSLVFSAVYCVFRGALWGQNNYFALCISEFFEQIVRIVACVFLVGGTMSIFDNALNVGWSMTIACASSMILVIILFFVYGGKLNRPAFSSFKPLVRQSTPITAIRVAGSFVQPLIALIIPARLMTLGYTSSQAMSLYGIAIGMTLPLLFVPSTLIGSLSTALIPDMSAAVAQGDHKHIESRVRTSIIFAIFVSALFVPVYMGLGDKAGIFLYDNALSGSLLVSAAWVMIPMGITNITSALLNSLGMEVKSFINYVAGSVFMFIALWFLPSLVGINALVWGMGVSFLVTAILNTIMLTKKTKLHLHLTKPLFKLILLIIPTAALTYFITNITAYFFPLFISLCLGGSVGVISFALLCDIFGLIDVRAFMITTKNRFKSNRPRKKAV